MSDDLTIEGKTYISSKRASELTGYTRDYIGQLARAGHIAAQRIGGLWYVTLDSLEAHKKKSEEEQRPEPSRVQPGNDPDTLVFFDGKDFVSASQASKITGYNPDYVAQLARAGKIASRQVGNRWYVERAAVVKHKEEKDALLAAVQAEAVGIVRPGVRRELITREEDSDKVFYTYTHEESRELLPTMPVRADENVENTKKEERSEESGSAEARAIPIRVVEPPRTLARRGGQEIMSSRMPGKTMYLASFTVVGVLTVFALAGGYLYLERNGEPGTQLAAVAAQEGSSKESRFTSASVTFQNLFTFLEEILIPEIVYKRVEDGV